MELFCDCMAGVRGSEHTLMDGSGVFTKGNENVHCQPSKKDVIPAAGNEDLGKQALVGDEKKTFCLSCCGQFVLNSVVWRCLEYSSRCVWGGRGERPWTMWRPARARVQSLS